MGGCVSKTEREEIHDSKSGLVQKRTGQTVKSSNGNNEKSSSDKPAVKKEKPESPKTTATDTAINSSGKPTSSTVVAGKRQQSVVSSNSAQSTGPSMGSLSKPGSGSSDTGKALKVLLLGSGESGKSTVLQQLKILHQNGFSNEELMEYRPFIYDNILETGKDIVKARLRFEVPLEDDSELNDDDLQEVLNFQPQATQLVEFPSNMKEILVRLWSLSSTQEMLTGEHRSSFYLMDSARYFMTELKRVASLQYTPTVRDVLLSRKKTSGIFDTIVEMDANLKLHIYDVGGQRSERKKWIHCFDNVTLIIFCVSLSEYDQTLLEDKNQNRLEESLILFDSVVNSRWFARASVVLFLNKIDIFAEKVQHVPLENYFSDYTGGQDINKAAKYILWRFVQLNRAHLNIYPHVTQATDTSNIKLVFAAIKETILENSLKDSGVL
ncbi:LADA_0D01464g1_1 [Lachancea dasiensis]|uniref:Guanine nucleotide-binding protein alpha-2 subunit n=1 Tax=Lachancea dasiensis TaxID=1072105 RepID=A0A1G4J469_9SACH|nr:LADA_0D01464g1_1 [Lachancea dasiensis]